MKLSDRLGMAIQRTVWQKRVVSWEHTASPNLTKVIDKVVELASVTSDEQVVDLGCGSGQVTLEVARKARSVLAVDISPGMIERLQQRCLDEGLSNVETLISALETLDLANESVDVIVSNYVMHHLSDSGKKKVVELCYRALRPGGRLVIGDMMFGRGMRPEDRKVIAGKVSLLAKKGLGGYWRIAKNAVRYLARVQERPIARERWRQIFSDSGFTGITVAPVVQEAAVIIGFKNSGR
jgi:ubiquinone/menaquinone biosynthesis C-methylase UbiE